MGDCEIKRGLFENRHNPLPERSECLRRQSAQALTDEALVNREQLPTLDGGEVGEGERK